MPFPDLRPQLARAIAYPRVAVSLVALVLGLGALVVIRPDLSSGPVDSVRLAATPVKSSYGAFTSTADFARGTRGGTTISAGTVHLGSPVGTRKIGDKSYEYATWTSPWVTPKQTFTQLVPSWTASTPTGSLVQVLVTVRNTAGTVSSAKKLGTWTLGDSGFKRTSGSTQKDAVARVSTDTVVAGPKALTGYRLTVRLLRLPRGAAPSLNAIGAATATPSTTLPATSVPLRRTAVSLAVPGYSQMTHRGHAPQYGGGGEAWCSPTSLSMVLGYYGRLPDPTSYAWVPKKYADRWVDHVARLTYDYAYRGTGNWPFNTAYAATRTGNAFVTRLTNLRMAERFLRAGIPVIVSIKFGKGQLRNAPITATAGHLVVLTGLTAAGNPIVNDPAAPTNKSVRRTYNRAEFERAWLRGSWGTAYIVTDAKHPLPKRPKGIHNW
ncbi:peptidase C39 family protein [Marmoricola sp. OAE513]|uniref:peptidase C39 family protein n=1 Tax=Marmoricola sp. OAE513 TaxID=2817894 RepID=UPI001AE28C02